jgi:hypothetical protein
LHGTKVDIRIRQLKKSTKWWNEVLKSKSNIGQIGRGHRSGSGLRSIPHQLGLGVRSFTELVRLFPLQVNTTNGFVNVFASVTVKFSPSINVTVISHPSP